MGTGGAIGRRRSAERPAAAAGGRARAGGRFPARLVRGPRPALRSDRYSVFRVNRKGGTRIRRNGTAGSEPDACGTGCRRRCGCSASTARWRRTSTCPEFMADCNRRFAVAPRLAEGGPPPGAATTRGAGADPQRAPSAGGRRGGGGGGQPRLRTWTDGGRGHFSFALTTPQNHFAHASGACYVHGRGRSEDKSTS